METRRLQGGRLRQASYDAATRELEIEFVDREVKRFKNVPQDVWRKLLAAPNPASFYEDRIEEEYAVGRGERRTDAGSARKGLDDLFGDS